MFARLAWLALGTFAIGTETWVIAALLPPIAGDLSIQVATAGALVTVFALAYAIGSPVLAVVAGSVERKWLLTACLGVFTIANIGAAEAQTFTQLLIARVLMALVSGLYVPTASAVATALVKPEQRGRAISIVIGGMAVAVALGAPLGALIGAMSSWRMTFWLVAALGALAVIGLLIGLPRDLPRPVTTLGQRLAAVRRPEILHGLTVTLLFATGIFTVFTYLALLLGQAAGLDPRGISATLFVFGVAAALGNAAGGTSADRYGALRTVHIGLIAFVLVFAVIGFVATTLPVAQAAPVIVVFVGLWGLIGWCVYAAQMANLVRLAPELAMVTLSLNASTFYFGVALGSFIGSLVVPLGVGKLAWIGAVLQFAALVVLQFEPRAEPVRRVAEEDAS
jgi:predicted MFS family arabinose efflux permease